MVQFLSIIFFSWIFFNFCWVFQKFPFFCAPLYYTAGVEGGGAMLYQGPES